MGFGPCLTTVEKRQPGFLILPNFMQSHATLDDCRGFGSFLGYYNAALRDYWFHGGSCSKGCPAHSTDLSNSSGLNDPAGVRPASDSVNGTYDADIFTAEALRVLQEHGGSAADDVPGLYMYATSRHIGIASFLYRCIR